MRRLFDAPVVRPFAVLLAALRGDQRSRGAMHEAARRRQGVGGAERRTRDDERRRATETETTRTERERRERRRFAIGRFIVADTAKVASISVRDKRGSAGVTYPSRSARIVVEIAYRLTATTRYWATGTFAFGSRAISIMGRGG